ncbi:transglutaminase domain-containing protein [Pseudoflavonifractor phocaeensis]|uniref:transglutaminaseTgpA domain-containing protein n=1 Tax=Pseudoflavonifractor phocaeensis TaxID=1870988 RepID=UPI00313B97C7
MRRREKRKPYPRGPLLLLGDGALLFLALAGTGFSAATAYGIEVDGFLLLAGCGALALLSLVLWSLPRYKLPLFLALAGGWAVAVWRLWEPLIWGEAWIRCAVVNTIAAKVPGVGTIVPLAKYTQSQWSRMSALWMLAAGAVLAVWLGWLICRDRRAWPVAATTLLPLAPALCVTEAPAALPMACLIVVWGTLALTSLSMRSDPPGAARMTPYALGASALVLALLMQVMPTEGYTQTGWAAQARSDLISGVNRLDLSALTGPWRGWRGSGSTEYVNLTGGGASRTGRTALRVHTDVPGKHYLRGYSADVYTGTRWEPLDRAAQRELEELRRAGVEPLLMLGQVSRRPIGANMEGETLYESTGTMTVENVSAPGGCVYYPYALWELPEGASFGGDSHLARGWRSWEHEIAFEPDWESPFGYGWSARDGQENGRDGQAELAYREFVYAHELEVPEGLRESLTAWLDAVGLREDIRSPEDFVRYWKWMTGPTASSVYGGQDLQITQEEVEQIRPQYAILMADTLSYLLSRNAVYNQDTPAPPVGEDYVEWFLNESRQGYCMHFATAGALLLRTMGIPARYVSGYVVDVPRTGYAVVPDSAAHAWVEVYLDGYGWYPLDFTPGFEGGGVGENEPDDFDPAASAAPEATPTPRPTESVWETPGPEAPVPTPSQDPQKGPGVGPGGGKNLSVWFLPPVVVLLAALGRAWALDRRKRRLRAADTNRAVLAAYVLSRRLIPWGGREDPALEELAGKARFSQHILTGEERDRALERLAAERRRVREALPGWKKPLFWLFWGSE